MTLDPKKLGPALLRELQRRSTQKNADKETLLEQLDDGSGAHLFVGEKNGDVSLLVPIEDGFEGPKRVTVTVAGDEALVLDDAKKDGTVEIEGKKFARFVLDPLRWGAQLDDVARPQVQVRGEGPDGTWSPLGFDDWFLEDYAQLRWLATNNEMIVAPDVAVDPSDPSWKKLAPDQRAALEQILARPLPEVVHESVLLEASEKAKAQGGVVDGALAGVGLAVDAPKRRASTKASAAHDQLQAARDLETARLSKLALEQQAKDASAQLKNAADAQSRIAKNASKLVNASEHAELETLKREKLVVDLTPGKWATKPGQMGDALIDATLFLSDMHATGVAKTLWSLERSLAKEAKPDTLTDAERETIACRYAFPDGSTITIGRDDDDEQLRAFISSREGRKIDVDFSKADLFHLPVLHDVGPAAAQVDEAMLVGPSARAELEKLGFVATTDRLFMHADGSWVALVPAKGARPGVKSGDAPRLAAGIADRQFDLKTPNAHRGNPFAQLPAWLQRMVKLSPPGENVDLQMMARQLAALDESMLKRLGDQRWTFDVTRYRVTNARSDLADVSLDDGSGKKSLAELANGVTTFDGDHPSIAVRTYFVDGQLRIDVSTLLSAVGIAFDQASKPPVHDEKDLTEAFDKEKEQLPKDAQNKLQFFAQTFALYMLDRSRCKRQFPMAFAALDKRFASMRPDGAKLLELERGYDRPAIVNLADPKSDLRNVLAFTAQQSQLFRDAGVPGRPLVVHLEGKDDWGAREYIEDAARHMRNAFGKDAGVFKSGENFVAIAPGTFNSADEMDKLLTEIETSGRAAVLYVDASQIGRGSAGFGVIEERVREGRDVPPLVLAGDSATLAGFAAEMPSVMRMNAKIDALTSSQQVERVKRRAAQDGFLLMKGVTELLEQKLKGGGYHEADEAWAALKRAQFERLLASADTSASLSTVREISLADAGAMKVKTVVSPQERLDAMIGQDEAKRQFDAIVKRAKVSALKAKEGVPESTPPRLNLLFSGSPGTGKTTFAEILGALLKDVGAIKNPVVTKVTIQDLLAGSPEAAVKALFENNKGGVIFLDEMHQLQDTAEGKRAFRAMIPYLADPAYQDTVFIGAGYSDELGSLVRDVDPGAERRFTTVPFLDYSKQELATILDAKAKAQNYVLDDAARDAALNFLEYRRRTTKNFGNAGEIDVALGHAQKAQVLRVADLPADKVTKRALMELTAADFAIPAPVTKEQFWKEMDAMTGWDDVKARLHSMGASIEGAVRRGKQPTDAVEPYWIVDGPPGTGKSTLARMLAKFGAAYGLTAVPEVVDVQGAGFQGEYVGQTAGVVKKQFEKAWGRLMFVDEVSGLAKSGGTFKDEATKIILAETENNRGKFMMVVADYAENINLFLGLDPGLPRRFGNRITLQPWPADQAAADLRTKLAADGVTTTKSVDAALTKQFAKLAKSPGYASGGDVRTIKNAIIAALDAGETNLAKAVDAAFADLITKKAKDNAGKKP